MSSQSSVVRSYAVLLAIALVVLVLDQTAKALVVQDLRGRPPLQVVGGLFQLDYTKNTGAAFSIFQSGGWIFAAVAIAVVAGIILYFPRMQTRGILVTAALGLVLGGAIGNLVDRVRLGYVIDFIDFRWFPVFNLADSAIVCGVGLLILVSMLLPEPSTS